MTTNNSERAPRFHYGFFRLNRLGVLKGLIYLAVSVFFAFAAVDVTAKRKAARATISAEPASTSIKMARLRVVAIGNIRFDVSGLNFMITPVLPFTVNTSDDHNDGICNVADCTLREAINAANAAAGTDSIGFSIGGGGAQTINLTSALPSIIDPVNIDGTTQTGFSTAPLIELNGTGAGASNGLNFQAGSGGSTVKALIINRFNQRGINVDGVGITVQGSYIGTNAAGTAHRQTAQGGFGLTEPPLQLVELPRQLAI